MHHPLIILEIVLAIKFLRIHQWWRRWQWNAVRLTILKTHQKLQPCKLKWNCICISYFIFIIAAARERVNAQDRELVETARLSFTIKHVFTSVMDFFYFFVCFLRWTDKDEFILFWLKSPFFSTKLTITHLIFRKGNL